MSQYLKAFDKAKSKPKPSVAKTTVKEPTNMSPTFMLATQLARKYARTKKRWFAEPLDEHGLTKDKKVRGEADFQSFRDLVVNLKAYYSYDLLSSQR